MPVPKNAAGEPVEAPPFDAIGLAKSLLRATRAGALATIHREGGVPFASLTSVATDSDGTPILLLSRLAAHTLNLEADPRASILLARTGRGDPLAHPRLTVTGVAERSDEERLRRRFLERHPKAALYADFPDFSFWRLAIASGHLNGGFARAAELDAGELMTDLAGADDLVAAEARAIAHMNEDHRDALALYATRLAKAPEGDWRISGLDPEGCDLAAGDLTARIPFPARVTSSAELRRVLVDLVATARETAG